MRPSLIELTNYCNDKGFELIPVPQGSEVSANLYRDGEFLKEGELVFKNWLECQRESYGKLYDILTKVQKTRSKNK